jgi:hypothetical protein
MNYVKKGFFYIVQPMNGLKLKNKKPPLFFFIVCMLTLGVMVALLNTHFMVENSTEISNFISSAQVEMNRLRIVLITVNFFSLMINSFGGYLIIACIFQVVFILSGKTVKFIKVIFTTFYLSVIGMLMTNVNLVASLLLNKEGIEIFTNLSFLAQEGTITFSLLQLLDLFIIMQFSMVYLFTRDIVRYKKWQSTLFVGTYVLLFVAVQLASVFVI